MNHRDEAVPDDGNEDVMVLHSQEDNFICPLTRKTFEIPMTK